jgi:RNA 2',3'-cyclic 3'-phosphodiesterase
VDAGNDGVSAALRHRFFFALQPPPGSASDIEHLSSMLGRGRRVRVEHFHITLAITGDYEEPSAQIADKMVRMPKDLLLAPFGLVLDQLAGSGRSLALRLSDKPSRLALLQRQLERALVRTGMRRPGWRFSPHLTLLYRHGLGFSHSIEPIVWRATELVLVHSHVGLTRHDILGRWPLLSGSSAALAP